MSVLTACCIGDDGAAGSMEGDAESSSGVRKGAPWGGSRSGIAMQFRETGLLADTRIAGPPRVSARAKRLVLLPRHVVRS